jgi:hypothetical protein
MTIGQFADKLRRYAAMKFNHGRKRLIFLRKPLLQLCRIHQCLRRRRPAAAAALPPALRPLHDALCRAGFTRADAVVDRDLVGALQRIADTRLDGVRNAHMAQLSTRKDFWQMIMTAKDLRPDSPLVAHALTPAVVDLATAYLGEVPYLSRIELVVSRPTDSAWKVSQLWHRDYNDRRMVKLFTYLSDVETEAQGPFTFLPADALTQDGPMFPVHKTDEQMARFGRLDARQQVLGGRGTSFLIDTHRCFHCGSRILDGSFRIAYIATFTTSTPYYAYDNEIALDETAEAQRMLLRA